MAKALDIYRKFATNKDEELRSGAKFVIDDETDTYIMVKRCFSRNRNLTKAQAELAKQLGERDDEEAEYQRSALLVRHLVVDWNNIGDTNGDPIPFSIEKAIEVLTDLPDLLDKLVAFAIDGDNYRLDKIAKN